MRDARRQVDTPSGRAPHTDPFGVGAFALSKKQSDVVLIQHIKHAALAGIQTFT